MKGKSTNPSSGRLSIQEKELRASDFGLPEDREYPMPDAVHVHAAEAYFRYNPDDKKPLLAHRILLKAKNLEWIFIAGQYLNGLRNIVNKIFQNPYPFFFWTTLLLFVFLKI